MRADPVPVSVIIPCYRCTETIGRALATVFEQTRPPAEIILVDDASGDDSLVELNRLAEEYGRNLIRVVPLAQNSGPGSARNAGWEVATQPYVAFLDADDGWHPRKLEIQYRWMSRRPDVALCGHRSALATEMAAAEIVEPVIGQQIHKWPLLVSNRFPTRSVMLRRDLPVRFQDGKRYSEDYLLWLEIVLGGMQAWRLDATLAFCFRPEFSAGGYSANLWVHERGELNAYGVLRRQGLLATPSLLILGVLSLLKFGRRIMITLVREGRLGNRLNDAPHAK
ncbi:MAG: glycosyltransferase family 2 protein [Sulfuricaulis sp.]